MEDLIQRIKNYFKSYKKFLKGKNITIFLGVIVFLMCSIWFAITSQLSNYHDGNELVVDNILTDLANGHYEQAYSLYADRYKKEENYKTFKKNILTIKPLYTTYKSTSFHITRTSILFPFIPLSLRYIGEITYENGNKATVSAIFIWEDNDWKLYLLEF